MNPTAAHELSTEITGPEDAPTLVFVHGWPDEATMWRHQIAALSARYRCVVPTLPNFGDTPHEAGGLDFPDIVSRLHATISAASSEPVTLVTHDWGAYIGYLYEQRHPENVRSMVAMDVGGHFEPSSLKSAAMFVGYQWTLVALWLIGGLVPPLGTALTRGFARALHVPERQASTLRSRCNYPYFYFWRSNLLPWARKRLLGDYTPHCPVMYVYGGNKPLMFHTPQWLDTVAASGGRTHCLEAASHWFMESHPQATNELLDAWLDEQVGAR